MHPLPPRSTLFPYTTLFRSVAAITRLDSPGAPGCTIATPGCGEAVWHAAATPPVSRTMERRVGLVTSRSEEHTSELQSRLHLVCRLLLEKKKKKNKSK